MENMFSISIRKYQDFKKENKLIAQECHLVFIPLSSLDLCMHIQQISYSMTESNQQQS